MTQTNNQPGHPGFKGPRNPEAPEVTVAPTVSAAAGKPAAVAVRVSHRGRAQARIRVTIFGLDSRWAPEPLDLGILQPGDSAAITLTILPERGALGASYPFTIAAEANSAVGVAGSSGSSAAAAGRARPVVGVAESTLVLDASERVSMSLVPSTPTAVFSRSIRVNITNPSGSERTFSLVPNAAAGAKLRLRRHTVTIPAQKTVSVSGRVRVRKPTVLGGQNTHTFTVAAQGNGAPEWVEGTLRSTAMIGRGVRNIIGLILVVALWVGLAVVFIPKISNSFTSKNDSTSAAPNTEAGGTGAGPGAQSGGAQGAGAGGGADAGAGGGGADGSGADGTGAGANGGAPAGGYQVTGTVTGPGAVGSSVMLQPVTLASGTDDGSLPPVQPGPGSSPKAMRGGGSAFVNGPALAGNVIPASSSELAAGAAVYVAAESNETDGPLGKIPGPIAGVDRTGFRTTTILTNDKGEFAFGGVTAPGYYLLTISKSGFQTQRFLINSVNLASPQPMKVELAPGSGRLSGSVTGPGGAIGAAQIVVTDGSTTLQTSSVSASTNTGTPGSWTLDQVSTPGTYLVTATSPGLGAASKLVTLDASGSAQVELALVAGLGSITGMVSGEDSLGNVGGLGGITVTATGGDTTRTATTVTSAAMRGAFVLPNLPTPGTYTLTISGAGFSTQTRDVTLSAGTSAVTVNATLSRADAVVAGMVTGVDANGKSEGGLGGVGLSLASNDMTMKTMTTSGASAGSYQFTGVAPGSYVLTAVQFGRVAASATVELSASTSQTVNLVLKADVGAELPATAHIRGQVADSRTGGPLTCDRALETVSASDCVATVTVTAPKDATDDSAGTVTYTSTATAALNFVYTIPDLSDPSAGLPPGLYTVTVKAPGYEDTTTHVQVAQGQTMPAPPASMPALGIISGTVTTRVGAPSKASCVLAIPVSVPLPSTLPTSCATSADGNTCTAPGISGAQPCALTSMGGSGEGPIGTFAVRGLAHGKYQMVLIAQDPEYVYTVGAAPIVTLELGADGQFNAVLDRLGRIQVSVLTSDRETGALGPASGVALTVAQTPGGTAKDAGTTDDNGGATITGLTDGTYIVTATSDATVVTGTSDPTGLNQTVDVNLVIAAPVGPLVGQVTTTGGDNTPIAVPNAVVTISGVVGYNGKDPVNGSVTVTANNQGCYAIVPHDWSEPSGTVLTAGPCAVTVDDPRTSPAAIMKVLGLGTDATLITDRIGISVAAQGDLTLPYPVTNVSITDCPVDTTCSTDVRLIPAVNVAAKPISADGLTLRIAGPGSGYIAPNLSDARIQVLAKPSLAGGVVITAAATPGGSSLDPQTTSTGLTFTDSQIVGTNTAVPGRYSLSVSLDDFVTTRIDLLCAFGSTHCAFVTAGTDTPTLLTLNRLPSISVPITAPSGGPTPDWPGSTARQNTGPTNVGNLAVVMKESGNPLVGAITFDNQQSAVAAANGVYTFSVSVPGYGTVPITLTCGANYLNPCTGPANLTALPTFEASSGHVSLSHLTSPLGDRTFAPSDVTATVSPNPGATISATVGADGSVTWKDTSPGTLSGQIVPITGSYTITYSLPGFENASTSFACTSSAATCGPTGDVELRMLPQAGGTITLPLAAGAATVNLSGAVVTATGSTSTSTLRLSLTNPTIDTAAHTATTTVVWNNSALPFAGIVRPDTYTVSVNVPGYEPKTISDVVCGGTPAGACLAVAELTLNPNPTSSMKLTILPATGALAALRVTSSTGAPSVNLSADSAGNLTWQQGNAPAGVVTPGSYTITATLSGYAMSVDGNLVSDAAFDCTDADDCVFPAIVLTAPTNLNIQLVGSDGSAVGSAKLSLDRTGASVGNSPETSDGTARFPGLSTTSVVASATPPADPSYTLSVQAAGYKFANGTTGHPLFDSNDADVSCTNNGVTAAPGLNLIPGGTTTCTITLVPLGVITAQTNWQQLNLDKSPSSIESLGNVMVTAQQTADADGTAVTGAHTFSGTSSSTGALTLTGAIGDGEEGLAPGTYAVTASLDGYEPLSGTIQIVADGIDGNGNTKYAMSSPSSEFTLNGSTLQLNMIAIPVDFQVHLQTTAGTDSLPPVTVTITDQVSPTPNSQSCTVANPLPDPLPTCVINESSPTAQYVQFTDIPPGTYTVTVTSATYATQSKSVSIVANQDPQQTTVNLAATASSLTGAVVDASHVAVDGATVSLWKWQGTGPAKAFNGEDDLTVETADQGRFGLDNIPNGDYQLVVDAPGYRRVISGIIPVAFGTAVPAQTVTITPNLRKVVITVTSNATPSADFSGATVLLTPAPDSGFLDGAPHVAANAVYTLSVTKSGSVYQATADQLPTGRWAVQITGQPGAPFDSGIVGGTIDVPDEDPRGTASTYSETIKADQAQTTLELTWAATCDVALIEGAQVPIALTQEDNAVPKSVVVTVNAAATAATGQILLPAGAYSWAPDLSDYPGCTAPTATPFTIDPGDKSATPAALELTTLTVPVTVSLTADGTASTNSSATVTATSTIAGDTETATLTGGSASLELPPATDWTFSIQGTDSAPVFLASQTAVTVSAVGTNTVTFEGYTLNPSVELDSDAPDDVTAGMEIKDSANNIVWSQQPVPVDKSAGWNGPSVIVPAGTYTLTATPSSGAADLGFEVGTSTSVTVGPGILEPEPLSATITYTAPTVALVLNYAAAVGTTLPSDLVMTLTGPGGDSATIDGSVDTDAHTVTFSGLQPDSVYTLSASSHGGATYTPSPSTVHSPTVGGSGGTPTVTLTEDPPPLVGVTVTITVGSGVDSIPVGTKVTLTPDSGTPKSATTTEAAPGEVTITGLTPDLKYTVSVESTDGETTITYTPSPKEFIPTTATGQTLSITISLP